MIIDHNGIVRTRNLDSEFEQSIKSIEFLIRRANDLSDELMSFQDHWKHTCEILKVEDLLKFGRNKETITDKDLLEKIQSLASEIEDVRWYLEKILEKMILYTDLHEQ